jgi:flagellar motor switch protein FliN/FliY
MVCLAINTTLKLTEEKGFDIDIAVVESVMEALMDDLGVSKNLPNRKSGPMTLDIGNIADIKINITAELGRTRVPIKYALELVKGSVVQLDTLNNSDIKVFANDVEFALAQVVAIEDNFGLRITKIISPEERLGNI